MLCAGMGYSQVKVFTSGKTFVGDNTGVTAPTEELQVNGELEATSGTFRSSGSSLLKFQRIGNSSMLMGVGGQTGFTFDGAYSFEIRKSISSAIAAGGLGTGDIVMKIRGADGHTAFGFNSASGFHRAIFNGTIQANGVTLPSDKRLKKDINMFQRGLDDLMKINPISYRYNGKAGITNTEMVHVGLFAQDLQQLAPELVRTEIYSVDEDTNEEYLSINDTGIKYMIINAVKEQQQIIEDQNQVIDDLVDEIITIKEILKKLSDDQSSSMELNENKSALLKQNVPNPFGSNTSIEYRIPDTAKEGIIEVFSSTGQIIESVKVSPGAGNIDINNNSMSSGQYFYRMIVDGEVIDTKKMTIAR